jgi:hypothetical protein
MLETGAGAGPFWAVPNPGRTIAALEIAGTPSASAPVTASTAVLCLIENIRRTSLGSATRAIAGQLEIGAPFFSARPAELDVVE